MTPCARLALSRRCRALVAWIAVLAIFVQAMLPALHALAMGGNGMLATADAGSTVVICTPTGFKRIALGDRPARDGSSQSAPIKAPLCPMCQAVQASATTVPTTAFAACDLRPAIAAAQFPPFDSRLVDRAYRSGLQARAPPPTV